MILRVQSQNCPCCFLPHVVVFVFVFFSNPTLFNELPGKESVPEGTSLTDLSFYSRPHRSGLQQRVTCLIWACSIFMTPYNRHHRSSTPMVGLILLILGLFRGSRGWAHPFRSAWWDSGESPEMNRWGIKYRLCLRPVTFVTCEMCGVFFSSFCSAWCLPLRCAVRCSHRRGEKMSSEFSVQFHNKSPERRSHYASHLRSRRNVKYRNV